MKSIVPWWAVVGLVGFSVLTVWLRLHGVKSTYEIHHLSKRKTEIQDQLARSKVELTGLKSPRRLQGISQGSFDLHEPRFDQIVYLK